MAEIQSEGTQMNYKLTYQHNQQEDNHKIIVSKMYHLIVMISILKTPIKTSKIITHCLFARSVTINKDLETNIVSYATYVLKTFTITVCSTQNALAKVMRKAFLQH